MPLKGWKAHANIRSTPPPPPAPEPEPLPPRREIPADTLRRLKFPVIAQENADGTTTYRHDPGIREGRIFTP